MEGTLCEAPPGCIVAGWEVERTLPCSAWGERELPILVRSTGFSSRRMGTGGRGSATLGISADGSGCALPPTVGDVT